MSAWAREPEGWERGQEGRPLSFHPAGFLIPGVGDPRTHDRIVELKVRWSASGYAKIMMIQRGADSNSDSDVRWRWRVDVALQASFTHVHTFLAKTDIISCSFLFWTFPSHWPTFTLPVFLLLITGTTKNIAVITRQIAIWSREAHRQGVFPSYDAFARHRVKVGARNRRFPITAVREKRSRLVISLLLLVPKKANPPPGLGGVTRPHLFTPLDAGIDMGHENGTRRQTPRDWILSPSSR